MESSINKSFYHIGDNDNDIIDFANKPRQPEGDFQVNGVVSRLCKAPNEYFCEVRGVYIVWKDESKVIIKSIGIEFNARGDGSIGLQPDPMESSLTLLFGSAVSTLKPSGELSFINSHKICQIHGYLYFDVPIGFPELHGLRGKFQFAQMMKSDEEFLQYLYSEVFILFPGYVEAQPLLNCPCDDCLKQSCVLDTINDSKLVKSTIQTCKSCSRSKAGYHSLCTKCDSYLCHDCYGANFQANNIGNVDCSKHELYEVQDIQKSKKLCLPGWIRRCDNCKATITCNEYQLCSYFLHCDGCNYNLCRACSFHPDIKYENIIIDSTIEKDFKLKLFGHTSEVSSLYVLPNSTMNPTLLISTSWDNTAIIWDLESGTKKRSIVLDDWIRDSRLLVHQINGESKVLAITVGDDCKAHVWDIDTDCTEPMCSFEGHSGYVFSLDIIPKLHVHGVASYFGVLGDSSRPTTPASIRQRSAMRVPGLSMFGAEAASKDFVNAIITGGEEGEVFVWDVVTGKRIIYESADAQLDMDATITSTSTTSADDSLIQDMAEDIHRLLILPVDDNFRCNRALVSSDSGIRMYNISTSPANMIVKFNTDGEKVYNLQVNDENDRKSLIGCGYAQSRSLMVWDLGTAELLYKLKSPDKLTDSALFKRDEDESAIVIGGCSDGQLIVWDTDTGHNRPRSLPRLGEEIDAMIVYQDARSSLPMIIVAAAGVIHMSLLSFKDSKVTSKVISSELKSSIVDEPNMDIVCCLDKDKAKNIVSIMETSVGTVDVIVAVTAEKFNVIDLFTGSVILQQSFIHFCCTAAAVINNVNNIDNTPLIACGGYVVFKSSGNLDASGFSDNSIPGSNLVKVYDLMNGFFIKSVSWSTTIDSLLCIFHGGNQDPHVVTIGKFETILTHEHRVTCWNIDHSQPYASVFYDKITEGNKALKRKIIVSYEPFSNGEELFERFYNNLMETAWRRGDFSSLDSTVSNAYDYFLCKPTLIAMTDNHIEQPYVYHLPHLNLANNSKLPYLDNLSIEIWTTYRGHEWYFGNDLSLKLVSLIATPRPSSGQITDEKAAMAERKMYPIHSNNQQVSNVRHVIVQELVSDRNDPVLDYFVSFDLSAFKRATGKCYCMEVSANLGLDFIILLFEDEINSRSLAVESSVLVVHNVRSKHSKSYHFPHKGKTILKVLPYKLSESIQKEPLVFIVFDNGIIRCLNTLFNHESSSDEDCLSSPLDSSSITDNKNLAKKQNKQVDPSVFYENFIDDAKDMKAGKDSSWPLTIRSLYARLVGEEEEDEPKVHYTNEEFEAFFDHQFWSRYEQIVYYAAEHKLENFFVQMKPYAANYCYNFNRALAIAIKNNSIRIVRILLDYWLVILNEEVKDKEFVYDWFHRPSAFFPVNTLISLVYANRIEFTKAFVSFICEVKLIKSPTALKGNNEILKLDNKETMAVGSLSYSDCIDIWRSSKASSTSSPSTSLDAYFIPMRNVSSLEMLSAFVRASEDLDNLDIFKSEVGRYAAKFAWEKYGNRNHVWETFKYFVFMVLFTTALFNFDSWIHQDGSVRYYAIWIIELLVGLYLLYYMINEVNEIKSSADFNLRKKDDGSYKFVIGYSSSFLYGKVSAIYSSINIFGIVRKLSSDVFTIYILSNLFTSSKDLFQSVKMGIINFITPNLEYFLDFWNSVDWVIIAMGLAGTILRLCYQRDTVYSISTLAVAGIGTWFKVLFYLLPYENSGRLVSAILKMCWEMSNFIFVLGIVIIGFAESFWLLSYPDNSLTFGSVRDSLINTYFLMFGQFPSDIDNTRSKELFYVLIVLFTLIVIILMLNLLIALLNDTYGRVRDNGAAQWRFDQTKTIITESNVWENLFINTRPIFPYVHIVKRQDSDVDSSSDSQLIARVDGLASKVDTFMKESDDRIEQHLKSMNEQMMEFMKVEFAKLKKNE